MAFGEYQSTLDERGRFALPLSLQELFAYTRPGAEKEVILLKGPGECIAIYNFPTWRQLLSKLRGEFDDDQSRLFMHFIVSECLTLEIDRSWRILIPRRFREYAHLDSQIIVVSLDDHLAIWDSKNLNRYLVTAQKKEEHIEEKKFLTREKDTSIV